MEWFLPQYSRGPSTKNMSQLVFTAAEFLIDLFFSKFGPPLGKHKSCLKEEESIRYLAGDGTEKTKTMIKGATKTMTRMPSMDLRMMKIRATTTKRWTTNPTWRKLQTFKNKPAGDSQICSIKKSTSSTHLTRSSGLVSLHFFGSNCRIPCH